MSENGGNVIRQYLAGSEGATTYMVVGGKDGLVMGIRPIFSRVPGGLQFGIRVRFCNPNEAEHLVNVKAYMMASPFGAFAWAKLDDVRASFVVRGEVPMWYDDTIESMFTKITKAEYIPAMMSSVYGNFDLDDKHPVADVYAFLRENFEQVVQHIIDSQPKIDPNTPCVMPSVVQ